MCALCKRTLTEYWCMVTVWDKHREPSALVRLKVCKTCAERVAESLQTEAEAV